MLLLVLRHRYITKIRVSVRSLLGPLDGPRSEIGRDRDEPGGHILAQELQICHGIDPVIFGNPLEGNDPNVGEVMRR